VTGSVVRLPLQVRIVHIGHKKGNIPGNESMHVDLEVYDADIRNITIQTIL